LCSSILLLLVRFIFDVYPFASLFSICIKLLILHAAGADDDISAIACFDLGEFVRFYPNGRSIARKLGAKDVAMKLIDHENTEVQRHALQCVSKMMVQNWAVSYLQ